AKSSVSFRPRSHSLEAVAASFEYRDAPSICAFGAACRCNGKSRPTFVTRHTFCNAAHGGRCTIEAVYRRSKRDCTAMEYRCAIEGHVAPIERSRRLLAPCDASMLDGSRRDGVGSPTTRADAAASPRSRQERSIASPPELPGGGMYRPSNIR